MFKQSIGAALRRSRNWVMDLGEHFSEDPTLYPLIRAMHRKLVSQAGGAQRPQYAWGTLQGAVLAQSLQIPRVSVVEFGVAGGNGLVALEKIAILCEALTGVKIDVYGFDTGAGLPKPMDFRDSPNLFSENDFPMQVEKLRAQLQKASLILGPVKDTIYDFINSQPAPVAFVSFDLDLYTATVHAMQLFEAPYSILLPRICCYFDDSLGFTHSEFAGERLAIREFNLAHQTRKISPIYGLKYFVSASMRNSEMGRIHQHCAFL